MRQEFFDGLHVWWIPIGLLVALTSAWWASRGALEGDRMTGTQAKWSASASRGVHCEKPPQTGQNLACTMCAAYCFLVTLRSLASEPANLTPANLRKKELWPEELATRRTMMSAAAVSEDAAPTLSAAMQRRRIDGSMVLLAPLGQLASS